MATKNNFESGSDPKFFHYGLKLPCAKFQNSNMLSPIISHIASAIIFINCFIKEKKKNFIENTLGPWPLQAII